MPVQEAEEFVATLQSVLEQFAHAMLHIGQGFTLQEKAEVLAVTQGPLCKGKDPWQKANASSGQAAEIVVAKNPGWGTDHIMPPSWALAGVRDHPSWTAFAHTLAHIAQQACESVAWTCINMLLLDFGTTQPCNRHGAWLVWLCRPVKRLCMYT